MLIYAQGGRQMWKLIVAVLILVALAIFALVIYFKQR
jgi:hypothetical protein